jgi:hypothetical protein
MEHCDFPGEGIIARFHPEVLDQTHLAESEGHEEVSAGKDARCEKHFPVAGVPGIAFRF